MTISAEMIGAYVDGELNEADRTMVEQALATDRALQAEVERQQKLRARLSAHFALPQTEEVPDRFRALLGFGPEAGAVETPNENISTANNVISFIKSKEDRAARRFWLLSGGRAWGKAGAIAATLVIGIALGQFGFDGRHNGPVAMRNGKLMAQDQLATALDTQLASSQPADASVRIGVSFRDQGDNLCRTFSSGTTQGIACRQDDNWELINTVASHGTSRPTQYRQASSNDPIIMQAAQAMMKGTVLDADAERIALAQKSK